MGRERELQDLKREYFSLAEKFTPEEIKHSPLIDLDTDQEIKITLTKELVEKLNLEDWLANYEKEAKVSTGGIRGPQNILYYWDTRFPINQMGVALATLGKALVLQEDVRGQIHKITAGEVRYNTLKYVDLISRIQAHLGIYSHLPFGRQTIPVWMVSFLIFMLDYDGGEFVTSSHAISSKIATKDLENQGSQFLPEMSLRFIEKIKVILRQAKENPEGYVITLAPRNSEFIKEDFNGYQMYADYLRKTVARDINLDLIKKAGSNGFKIMYDTVGGCMYRAMLPILQNLGIEKVFDWRNKEEDPFFHGIGKVWRVNPKTGIKEFFDLSCDFCLIDVVKSASFEKDLKDKPVGHVVLITDPDGDRLVIGQVESREKIAFLEHLGVDYISVNDQKIFAVYNPTYSFFLIMDYYVKQLKQEGTFQNHPRFIVATTPSSRCWDEWAEHHGIKVVTVPVGMKEIATVIKKVEKQILENPGKEVVIENIYGEEINLGVDPRMIFGGEESGGMITGLEDFIESKTKKRKAFAMREKSAGEASVIATALAAYLFENEKLISEYLEEMFKESGIKSTQYVRDDIIYYNESEPDPIKLRAEKEAGEVLRDKADTFYLAMTLALRDKKITMAQVKEILAEALPGVDFSHLQYLKFTGDATYFQFDNNMFVQVRRSGTDAKMRGYACGPNKQDCTFFLNKLLHYKGDRTDLYNNTVPKEYQENIHARSQKIYKEYLYKGL